MIVHDIAAALFVIWFGCFAPQRATVIPGRRIVQLGTNWAVVVPASCANGSE